ncbi:MAG: metal-dependent hydrolase [Clostridia bacterium]|jgi:inner membrane protein|nr:metal-dependent hydrolase [Clostridia bacterium]
MDPITHAIAGLVIGSKTGAGFTMANGLMIASTLGAVAPDFDIVARCWGDYVYLKQHRTFSHSLPGLAVLSLLAGAVLLPFYPDINYWHMVFWAFLGALSHSFLDSFNSYGVSLLWPFTRKKLSLSLLLIFDPFLLTILLFFIFAGTNLSANLWAAGLFTAYLGLRQLMRLGAYRVLEKELPKESPSTKLTVLPVGFAVWDFIASFPEEKLIGTVDCLKRKVRILASLENVKKHLGQAVTNSVLGRYFLEFTPHYHISCEQVEDKYVARMMDLRYRVKDRFMHNATLVMDADLQVEEACFQPFRPTKKIYV